MAKAEDALKNVSDVTKILGVKPHVLRYWEGQFAQVKPMKRAGGRRYYRQEDVWLLAGIQHLLHDEGLTIKGVRKIIASKGVGHVADLARQASEAADSEAGDAPSADAETDDASVDVPENDPMASDGSPSAGDVAAAAAANLVQPAEREAAVDQHALSLVYDKLKQLRARMAAEPV